MSSLALRRLSQRISTSRPVSLINPQPFTQGCSTRRWLSELSQESEEPNVKKKMGRPRKTTASPAKITKAAKEPKPKEPKPKEPKPKESKPKEPKPKDDPKPVVVKKPRKKKVQEPILDMDEESAELDDIEGTPKARQDVAMTYLKRRHCTARLKDHVQSEEYVPDMTKLTLPPINDWRTHFPWAKDIAMRAAVRNPDTAALLADAFLPEGSKDCVVIEANPGPGQMTRALLQLPRERLKKLIVMEHGPYFYEYVKPLQMVDDRVTVIPYSGKDWSTYNRMKDMGLLDELKTEDWKNEHSQLRFIMTLSASIEGEQLLSQLFRAIPDRQWLFRYGRVPLNFILSQRVWARSVSPAGSKHRCKISVMGQAAADLQELLPKNVLSPFSDHFHPRIESRKNESSDDTQSKLLEERRMGTQHIAVRVTPWADNVIQPRQLEFWDYCLRNLFIQSATPLQKAINLLGPGGYNLLPKLEAQGVDISKTSRDFSVEDWRKIVETFQAWPFRPEDLSIDAYTDSQISSGSRT